MKYKNNYLKAMKSTKSKQKLEGCWPLKGGKSSG